MFGYPLSGVIISICKKGLEFNFVQKSEKKQILFNFFSFLFLVLRSIDVCTYCIVYIVGFYVDWCYT